ncbi:unnamed protein product [Microthlaspi erraticum]|uniref:S-protein homolog n=1 Tax=Microthlaspi erraticum TaxID=1685480 RepID=A0A6D2HWM1_9BRAS|nr:unnamed protein product [Microthlaspi erraticum]
MQMNRVSFILFVFAISLTMMSKTALSETVSVWIRNLMHNGNDLIVHCKSTEKDMGYHMVHSTGSYHVLYKDSDYSVTPTWCHLWQGPNFKHHQVFDIYDGEVWEAREDGIYMIDGRSRRSGSEFTYGWDVPLTLSKASSLRSTYMISLSLLVSSLFLFYFSI